MAGLVRCWQKLQTAVRQFSCPRATPAQDSSISNKSKGIKGGRGMLKKGESIRVLQLVPFLRNRSFLCLRPGR